MLGSRETPFFYALQAVGGVPNHGLRDRFLGTMGTWKFRSRDGETVNPRKDLGPPEILWEPGFPISVEPSGPVVRSVTYSTRRPRGGYANPVRAGHRARRARRCWGGVPGMA